ncbi:MAG: glycerol-3-phosphate dehydrogenase [Nitratireductor sp.]|nr:glycerol-3-phosphate dehydrogenase [Nitratireductor sp.]
MSLATFDIFIIGGGINGCGIARDAAGRGYSVMLAEMNDLASGTSSWSTKLVHGGLRYLEHYEFKLVREALEEREVLWALAPHVIHSLRFVLPMEKAAREKGTRPAWLIRLGLFLYDHIGGRRLLPATRTLDLRKDIAGKSLKPGFDRAFEYSDCRVDDARLVVLNAMDAMARGAEIAVRSRVVKAERRDKIWLVTLEDTQTGSVSEVRARMLVNAAGPWVDTVIEAAMGRAGTANVRLVQGSHIVVRRKFEHDRAYIFQKPDGRIFFAIPYERDYTLIGTTDRDYSGDPGKAEITPDEINYLCEGASEYFRQPVDAKDIVWAFSGVRPLFDDGASKAQEATREYVIRSEGDTGQAQLVNIFGGKITTYRKLAEHVMEVVEAAIGRKGRPWTHSAKLPGGDFAVTDFAKVLAEAKAAWPFLNESEAERLTLAYGTRIQRVLAAATSRAQLGRDFGHGLSEAEVLYLMTNEWARTAEDVLWRRSKLGLKFSKDQANALDEWMRTQRQEGTVG